MISLCFDFKLPSFHKRIFIQLHLFQTTLHPSSCHSLMKKDFLSDSATRQLTAAQVYSWNEVNVNIALLSIQLLSLSQSQRLSSSHWAYGLQRFLPRQPIDNILRNGRSRASERMRGRCWKSICCAISTRRFISRNLDDASTMWVKWNFDFTNKTEFTFALFSGGSHSPSAYTRVSAYRPWIVQQLAV